MESGYGKYPQSVKDGLRAEARFDRLRGTHVLRKATEQEDIVGGFDRVDDEYGTVGIKAMCGVHRGDEPQDVWLPLELLNRDRERAGWGFKPYDTQAYEVREGFLLVKRSLLVPLACGWGLPLTDCGVVWMPRERLAPYGTTIKGLDKHPPIRVHS
jgi:hypothetical protein